MAKYEVVYWELTRISHLIDAPSVEKAIAKAERRRARGDWTDCDEESEGTNGVERVYRHSNGNVTEVYNSGTIAGMVDPK